MVNFEISREDVLKQNEGEVDSTTPECTPTKKPNSSIPKNEAKLRKGFTKFEARKEKAKEIFKARNEIQDVHVQPEDTSSLKQQLEDHKLLIDQLKQQLQEQSSIFIFKVSYSSHFRNSFNDSNSQCSIKF